MQWTSSTEWTKGSSRNYSPGSRKTFTKSILALSPIRRKRSFHQRWVFLRPISNCCWKLWSSFFSRFVDQAPINRTINCNLTQTTSQPPHKSLLLNVVCDAQGCGWAGTAFSHLFHVLLQNELNAVSRLLFFWCVPTPFFVSTTSLVTLRALHAGRVLHYEAARPSEASVVVQRVCGQGRHHLRGMEPTCERHRGKAEEAFFRSTAGRPLCLASKLRTSSHVSHDFIFFLFEQLDSVEWDFNLQLAEASRSRMKDTNAVFQLNLSGGGGCDKPLLLSFNHQQLLDFHEKVCCHQTNDFPPDP